MCVNSRADSTRRCYKNAFEKWCKWCVSVKLPSFLATEFHGETGHKLTSTVDNSSVLVEHGLLRAQRLV